MINVREAVLGDLKELLRLYTMLHNNAMPETNEKIENLWLKMLKDEAQHIIVVEDNGRLISSCICLIVPNLTHDQRPFAVVENVVTDSDYRGRGHASACLDEAKRIAERENCYKIMLTTGSKLESTLRFYERAGYNREDKTAFVQWL